MFRRALLLGLLLTMGGCSFYMGEPRLPKTDFRATLNGASEVPPNDTKGSGYLTAVYRPSTKVLEYRFDLVGLSGPVTIAYLQGPAAPGENGEKIAPIDVPFYRDRSHLSDGVTLTEEQAAQLVAGRWYVNVMTEKYPDGEIRGQILPLKK